MTYEEDGGHDEVAEARLQAAVASISGHARSVNQARADRLTAALAGVAEGRRDEAARREATEVAHQIVGSAGIFGFPGASRLAGEIERYFAESDLDDPVQLARARDQARRLTDELAGDPDYQPDDERDPTS